ncbi:MAG: class IV adenylate cyclase [Sedimentisphaerales bacterium]|nr:class IV adenylate cyclase [Sedimentisphaerales bacterium]
MSVEIETKLKVKSFAKVRQRLNELGAKFMEEQIQNDYYFDNSSCKLLNSDKCLRLRQIHIGKSKRYLLTFKGPKQKNQIKKRYEVEVEIKQAGPMRKLLSMLGYEKVLSFKKKRQIWQLKGCEVALDRLPLLGNFIEIEGPNEKKITDVQRNLGLTNLQHLPQSYASLMEEKLRQRQA